MVLKEAIRLLKTEEGIKKILIKKMIEKKIDQILSLTSIDQGRKN